jgi:hypothetical protein
MAAADSDGECVTQRQTKSGPPNKKKKATHKRYAQREIPATTAWRLAAQTALANAWHEPSASFTKMSHCDGTPCTNVQSKNNNVAAMRNHLFAKTCAFKPNITASCRQRHHRKGISRRRPLGLPGCSLDKVPAT